MNDTNSVISKRLLFAIGLLGAAALFAGCSQKDDEGTDDDQDEATVEEEAASPGAATSGTVSGTSGWKTYNNTSLGYTVKYPPTWKVDSAGEYMATKEIAIRSPQPNTFGQLVVRIEAKTMDDIRTEYVTTKGGTESQTTIGGQTGYSYEYTVDENPTATGIYVPYNDKVFYIEVGEFQQPIVQQVVSTFRFK